MDVAMSPFIYYLEDETTIHMTAYYSYDGAKENHVSGIFKGCLCSAYKSQDSILYSICAYENNETISSVKEPFREDLENQSTTSANNSIFRCKELTRGLGGAGKPDVGMNVAKESRHSIEEALNGSDMVGMGAGPIITGVAKSMGILIVGNVTTPFSVEGRRRAIPGSVNVDFADVRAIVANAGSSLISWKLVNTTTEVIYDLVDPTAYLIFGAVIDPSISGEVSITLIATGVKREQESRLSYLKDPVGDQLRNDRNILGVREFEPYDFNVNFIPHKPEPKNVLP
ncbi:hypothetical protein LXL04_001251 [Taraxacum kok-saghyz]